MKKTNMLLVFSLILSLLLTTSFHFLPVEASTRPITLVINGEVIKPDVPPQIINYRTLVPVRFVSENLGMKVEWDSVNRKVNITDTNGKLMVLTIDKKEVQIGNKTILLDVPAKIINYRTFIPVRFVSENFGATVDWDSNTYTVTVTKGNVPISGGTVGGDTKPTPQGKNPAYNPNYADDVKWLNTTRIDPNYYSIRHADKLLIESGKLDPMISKSLQDRMKYEIAEELLWEYYKGEIPASPYEKEVMDRVAKKQYFKESWADLTEYEKARYHGSLISPSHGNAMLLNYHFNEDGKLDWFIFRPVGMRHAFKIEIKDPIESFIANGAWAGYSNEKFNGVYTEIATPEWLDRIVKDKIPVAIGQNMNVADDSSIAQWKYNMTQDVRIRAILKNHMPTYYVKWHLGGDYKFTLGGGYAGYWDLGDFEEGSKVLPPDLLERKPFNPNDFKIINDINYSYY
ncbi:MAG: copper amine oxidase N-terminal domain-containing protein [Tepidibacillus sp.]